MTKNYDRFSMKERNPLTLWATSAATCWIVLTAGTGLAGMVHLINLA